MRHYNDNILLEEQAFTALEELAENQFYALMVEDKHRGLSDNRKFFDVIKEWLGLERTDDRVYISKSFNSRHNPNRGTTFTVRIKDISQCCVLT